MKTSNLSGAMLLAVVGTLTARAETRVTLCLKTRALVSHFVVERAKSVAGRTFSEAGFDVAWSTRAGCQEASSIHIEIDGEAPAGLRPGAMAYALPYGHSAVSIHIFYDRVVANYPAMTALLLGEVMAHEVTHVLQGVIRHSESGLMKACWGPKEYYAMRAGPLPLAGEDLELARIGIAKRAGSALSARR
jgi:hypothetical protein